MHRVAALVEAWHHQQRAGTVARVIATDGLGPQHRDELLLIDADGRTGGSLLGGALSLELSRATRALLDSDHAQQVVTLDIDGGDATAAGLTCGGTVHVLVQRLDTVPEPLWASFAAGRSVALVTPLDGEHAAVVVHPGGGLDGTLGSSALDTMVQAEAEALLAQPGAGVNRLRVGDLDLVIEAWDPTPRVVIVGASDLSAAIERQAELIGWAATTVIHAAAATEAVGGLDHGDAVLVIDHDPFVATPALGAALARNIGYVGALGSRRTQEHRRQHLTDVGVSADAIERLHGPAGLDLGARAYRRGVDPHDRADQRLTSEPGATMRPAPVTGWDDEVMPRTTAEQLLLGEWACLGVLYQGPTHGFAIASRLKPGGDIGRVWSLSRPLTYRSLDQLTQRGHIHPIGEERGIAGGNRTILAATRQGRAALRKWVATPVAHLRDLRSELLLKLVIAEQCGIDVLPMLQRQRERVATIAGALDAQATDAEHDVVTLWRNESSDMALRFIGEAEALVRGRDR